MKRIGGSFLILALVVAGCGATHVHMAEKTQGPGGAPTVFKPTPVVPLSADNDVNWQTIHDSVLASCRDCHRKMDTLAGVVRKKDKILPLVTSADLKERMPPADKGYAALSLCQQAVLQKWLELGLPEAETGVKVSSFAECADLPPAPTDFQF